eukprot:COSAG04_NODE_9393_length_868_cov_0.897269_1_plen_205_part_10
MHCSPQIVNCGDSEVSRIFALLTGPGGAAYDASAKFHDSLRELRRSHWWSGFDAQGRRLSGVDYLHIRFQDVSCAYVNGFAERMEVELVIDLRMCDTELQVRQAIANDPRVHALFNSTVQVHVTGKPLRPDGPAKGTRHQYGKTQLVQTLARMLTREGRIIDTFYQTQAGFRLSRSPNPLHWTDYHGPIDLDRRAAYVVQKKLLD